MQAMKPSENTSILDVGVTCDQEHDESNFFEHLYPHKTKLTCVGIEDGSFLEKKYPGITFQKIKSDEPLPFADGQFDIVYSNAVLEHVGDRKSQRVFVAELCRVGRRVFLAAPNRLFPVEHHTALPLLHYLPNSVFRKIAKILGLAFWADEKKLNLFYPWKLIEFFPKTLRPRISYAGIGWGIWKSNVFAYTDGFREPVRKGSRPRTTMA